MCIWHYTASWCEQCLNYCIEMLSKQKKLPRLNPQGRQSSPDQLWKDRERAATVWLQASFLRRQADIETKVNKLNAPAPSPNNTDLSSHSRSWHSLWSTLSHLETHSQQYSFCFLHFSSNYKSTWMFLPMAHSSEFRQFHYKVQFEKKTKLKNSINTLLSQNSVWKISVDILTNIAFSF